MIADVTIKYTKNNKTMAFITLEDLTGTVEVIVFPNSFETSRHLITENSRVFIKGRVQAEEEKDAKVICQDIKSFDDCNREIWLQFANKDAYNSAESNLANTVKNMDGKDTIIIYLKEEKARKALPPNWGVGATSENLEVFYQMYGKENVAVKEKKVQFAQPKRGY